MPSNYVIAVICMLISMLSYQVSASLAKQLFQVLDPLTVTILRLIFAFIFVFVIFRSWKIIKQLKFLAWKDLILYSLSLGLMNILFYLALEKIPLGIAVGLEFIGPLAVALFAVQQKRDYIWVILAILGIIGLIPYQQIENFSLLGAMFALGAGVCWGSYIHFGQRIVQQNIGMHGLTIGIGCSVLYLLPFALWNNAPAMIETQYWGTAIAIAFLATAVPYALDLYALKFLNKMVYGTLTSLSPALAGIAGFVLLGEVLGFWQMMALACIVLASIGVTVFARHRQ